MKLPNKWSGFFVLAATAVAMLSFAIVAVFQVRDPGEDGVDVLKQENGTLAGARMEPEGELFRPSSAGIESVQKPIPLVKMPVGAVGGILPGPELQVMLDKFEAADVTQRGQLAWELALTDHPAVVPVLLGAVTNAAPGRRLSDQERNAMLRVTRSLALLVNHDAAYQFLKAGTDLEFWTHALPWQADGDLDRMFAAASIQSIALGGHPGTEGLLHELTRRDLDYLTKVGSSLIQAAAWYEMSASSGTEFLKSLLPAGDQELFERYRTWKRTPYGSKWQQWMDSVRARKPIEPPI